jgi:drug/metabolite transporter (DMT)-like permease
MLIAASFLGLTATLVDLLYQKGYTIPDLTNAQYGFGAVITWLFTLPFLRKLRFPRGLDWIFIAGTGITSAWGMYFYFKSLTFLPVSLSIVLLFQFSWMVTVIDIMVKRTSLPAYKWGAIAVILAGTLLAVGALQANFQEIPLRAVGYGLLAAFSFSLSLYLPEYISERSSPLARAALTLTVGMVSLFPVFPPTYLSSGVLLDGLFEWGLITGLMGQTLPLLFMMVSIPRIGGRMAGVLASIELPATVIFALFLLNESVDWVRWLGVLLIIGGICLSEMYKNKERRLQH